MKKMEQKKRMNEKATNTIIVPSNQIPTHDIFYLF